MGISMVRSGVYESGPQERSSTKTWCHLVLPAFKVGFPPSAQNSGTEQALENYLLNEGSGKKSVYTNNGFDKRVCFMLNYENVQN